MLDIVEIDADNRIVARVMFDLDDIDAAFEELDSRYLAGEAAAHSQTWSVIAKAYAALNRHELPATTPDWVNIDHRRGTAFAPGEMTAYIRTAWDVAPDLTIYIETVHRLSNLGAVFTHAAYGTSQEGFDAEWRMIEILTVEGDLINRCEMFDETDLDAALARFDELSRPARRLENAANQVLERLLGVLRGPRMGRHGRDTGRRHLRRRSSSGGERRRPTRSGCRDREHAGVCRGWGPEHNVDRHRDPRGAPRPHSCLFVGPRPGSDSSTPRLSVIEIDADNRISAHIVFDPDDIDAAFEELDARYLAGEAAAHSHTWSFIAGIYAALNRRELPATTPDWVNIDHRRGKPVAPGDLIASLVPRGTSRRISLSHRDRASAEQPRSGRHSHVAWDVTTGLRRRVAGDRPIDARRRPDQPLRDVRRGRHRRRTRPIRRTQPSGAAAGKRGKPSKRALSTYFAARDWDAMAEILADDITARTAAGWWRRSPTRSRCRNCGHAGNC